MELDYGNQLNKKIRISEKSKATWVEVGTITYLVCESYLTIIHLNNNETITCTISLKQFEEILVDMGFIRANRNTIVNH
jgi:DNA-binding LytR/AlgR family response regulator